VADIAKVPVHRADGLRRLFEGISRRRLHHLVARQEGLQRRADRHNGIPGAAAAMGNAPGLVQVVMHGIDA
jgi:hypothetical protein